MSTISNRSQSALRVTDDSRMKDVLQLTAAIVMASSAKKKKHMTPKVRSSDILRGRGPAKFRYFHEIRQNSQKNAKYREIPQEYFQINVGKPYLLLILAIRPVSFTPNVQIYLETLSLQRVNNVPKLPGVLMLRKTGH